MLGESGMAIGAMMHVNQFHIYNCVASYTFFMLNILPFDWVKSHNLGGVSHYENLILIIDDTWVQIDYDGVHHKDIVCYGIVDCV